VGVSRDVIREWHLIVIPFPDAFPGRTTAPAVTVSEPGEGAHRRASLDAVKILWQESDP
jgi:hypothetical protein